MIGVHRLVLEVETNAPAQGQAFRRPRILRVDPEVVVQPVDPARQRRRNRREEGRAVERDDVVVTLRVVGVAPFKVPALQLRADLEVVAARDIAQRALEGLRREAVVVIGEP